MSHRFPRTTARPLTDATLRLHGRRADIPSYDRRSLRPGVVHIGVGNFQRAHAAVYFDDLAGQGVTDWGVVGVGLHSPEMRAALGPQDGLYTVITRTPDRDRARVIGVLGRYFFAPRHSGAVLDRLVHPRTRLVTLTVTGAAYKVDPGSGRFRPDDPEVAMDLSDPGRPVSALGFLVEALDRRRRAGRAPFTVLSCDNLPDNGRLTRDAVLAFAALRDDRLAGWIAEHVAFPSSMVDRITPRTTDEDRRKVAWDFGIIDRWPVIAEPFSQWVIENTFCDGRPPLDRVGATFVPDVAPYALLKTRMLNGAHCAIGYLGMLAGLERIDEAMADPVLGAYVDRLLADEVAPVIPHPPGVDVDAYRRTLLARFSNPRIGDELSRLGRGGSAKVPFHLVPTIVEARRRGRPHRLLTLAVAAWLWHLRGVDDAGRPVPVEDPLAERLQTLMLEGGANPRPFLADRRLFGELSRDPGFAEELEAAIGLLERLGARGAVGACLAPDGPVIT